MDIFDFERLFDLNHDGTLDPRFLILFSKQFSLQAKSEMNFSIEFISLIFLFIVILFKRYSL